jgi:hypothetical protein
LAIPNIKLVVHSLLAHIEIKKKKNIFDKIKIMSL